MFLLVLVAGRPGRRVELQKHEKNTSTYFTRDGAPCGSSYLSVFEPGRPDLLPRHLLPNVFEGGKLARPGYGVDGPGVDGVLRVGVGGLELVQQVPVLVKQSTPVVGGKGPGSAGNCFTVEHVISPKYIAHPNSSMPAKSSSVIPWHMEAMSRWKS